ncbi:MAG: TMEM165/GDT1 family protein [Actinomycetota bacterium]|nr:TMEM165/GDT1 family protein [Actinomycetota bacterium]
MTAFATIFLAELPDKTMLATIVLSARFRRPVAVWTGAAAALTAQVLIATTAGRLLSLLPQRPVRFAVAALFAIGAIVLWRSRDDTPDENDQIADDLAESAPDRDYRTATRVAALPGRRIAASVFGIVFLAEWGDLTQIATASLAAKGHAVSVFVVRRSRWCSWRQSAWWLVVRCCGSFRPGCFTASPRLCSPCSPSCSSSTRSAPSTSRPRWRSALRADVAGP